MAHSQPRVVPVLNGDEARYRRRYRALKDMVNDLSDESNLLALRVHQIQRRVYDRHMAEFGRPPAPVPVPEDATWAPLVQNATHYPGDIGAPPPEPVVPEVSSPAAVSAPAGRGAGRGGAKKRGTGRDYAKERERARQRAREREEREREAREKEEREREAREREARAQYDDDDDDDEVEDNVPDDRNGREHDGHDDGGREREPLPSSPPVEHNVDRDIEDMMDDY